MLESIAEYFESIPSSHRTIILIGGIGFFWYLETAVPQIVFRYKKWQHACTNLFYTFTTILINFSLAFFLLRATDWVQARSIGILSVCGSFPELLRLLAGLALLDLFGAYLPHWLEHKVGILWRFHLVHHSDNFVDTTTANRHHPGESFLRFAFTIIAVVVTGAPLWMVMLYQSVSVIMSQFNHANIRVPIKLDRWLSLVLVTPRMHHIHHHYQQPLTDRNFGNIFSFWDRLLGTFACIPEEMIIYGIDSHPDPEKNSQILRLIAIPFLEVEPILARGKTPEHPFID
ncbi:MAG: sterol desaturase family protein [Planctomycetes bacterium]|nr:sterol desaturase family protein [Planctomycetota bacterium]